MTHEEESTILKQVIQSVLDNGFLTVSALLNEAMKIECSRDLGACPWERTRTRLE